MVVVRGGRAATLAAWALASGLAACAADPPGLEAPCAHIVRVERARRAACDGFVPMADEEMLIERAARSCTLYWGAAGSAVGSARIETCAAAEEGNCADAAECNTYPYGRRAPGQPCYSFAQCSTLYCGGVLVPDENGNANPRARRCGTCAEQLPEGVACNGVTDFCQAGTPGLSCFRGACRQRGFQGAACDAWNDCAAPWICTSDGVCGGGRQAGQTCVSGTDCLGDLSCDPTTKTCALGDYSQPGDACDNEFHWCWTGRCDIAAGATTGVCPLVLPDGSACDPDDTARTCDAYAYCMSGVCKIPEPNACG